MRACTRVRGFVVIVIHEGAISFPKLLRSCENPSSFPSNREKYSRFYVFSGSLSASSYHSQGAKRSIHGRIHPCQILACDDGNP